MAALIKIGNSQGIRIPKLLIQQAQLENSELELIVVDKGLLIRPIKPARSAWSQNIQLVLAENKNKKDEVLLLDDNDLEDFKW